MMLHLEHLESFGVKLCVVTFSCPAIFLIIAIDVY